MTEEKPKNLEENQRNLLNKNSELLEENAVIVHAKEVAQENARQVEEHINEVFIASLSEDELKKLEEISFFLGLSEELTIKTTVSYVLKYAREIRKTSVDKLQGYIEKKDALKTSENTEVRFELSLKEKNIIEDMKLVEKVSECLILGIKLVHMALIESKRIG